MGRFYASIQGNRGMATRMGNKSSGIDGHIRGWEVGVRVSCYYDEVHDRDICEVYRTGGSHNSSNVKLIAKIHSERRI
jgi:hypothetical protein